MSNRDAAFASMRNWSKHDELRQELQDSFSVAEQMKASAPGAIPDEWAKIREHVPDDEEDMFWVAMSAYSRGYLTGHQRAQAER
jgi:hypothetical protein